jgi:sugar phosphate isomerase/epimerase
MAEINRRQFLASTACFAAAAGVGGGLAESTSADPLGLPLGIQLYTVGDDMQKDAPGTLKKIAEIGYKEVETAGFGSAGSAAALRKILDDNGLKCPSAHLTFDLNDLNKAFDDAHALGCTYATSSVPRMMILQLPSLSAGSTADRAAAMQKVISALSAPLSSDELKRLIDAMNKVGAAAHAQGLTFASHNHTFEFAQVDGQPAIHYMISQTDPKNVVFEIDCGWAEVAGYNPVDLVNQYPGRIKMLHIKDFLQFEKGAAPGGPNSPKGSEIGQGVVNYKEIFAGMKGKGIQHIFVEQEGPYSRMPAMQSAEVDYKYLHALS